MTKKELRTIIMAAAEEAVAGHRRADGSSKWIIRRVCRARKEGYGWYWVQYQDPCAFVASLFPDSIYSPPCNVLHHLGDAVADAQREHDRKCHERSLRQMAKTTTRDTITGAAT